MKKHKRKRPVPVNLAHIHTSGLLDEPVRNSRTQYCKLVGHEGDVNGAPQLVEAEAVPAGGLRALGFGGRPLLVETAARSAAVEALGLAVPMKEAGDGSEFCQRVSLTTEVHCLDVSTQQGGPRWSMYQWTMYWTARLQLGSEAAADAAPETPADDNDDEANSAVLQSTRSPGGPAMRGISLESKRRLLMLPELPLSGSSLQLPLQPPTVVLQASLLNESSFRETGMGKDPMYACMMPAGAWRNFALTPAGAAMWLYVATGRMVVHLLPPTASNLSTFAAWAAAAKNMGVSFLDCCKDTMRCDLKTGDLLLMPPGWIHALVAVRPSLSFGGLFLMRDHYPAHLQTLVLERYLHVLPDRQWPQYQQLLWLLSLQYTISLSRRAGLPPFKPRSWSPQDLTRTADNDGVVLARGAGKRALPTATTSTVPSAAEVEAPSGTAPAPARGAASRQPLCMAGASGEVCQSPFGAAPLPEAAAGRAAAAVAEDGDREDGEDDGMQLERRRRSQPPQQQGKQPPPQLERSSRRNKWALLDDESDDDADLADLHQHNEQAASIAASPTKPTPQAARQAGAVAGGGGGGFDSEEDDDLSDGWAGEEPEEAAGDGDGEWVPAHALPEQQLPSAGGPGSGGDAMEGAQQLRRRSGGGRRPARTAALRAKRTVATAAAQLVQDEADGDGNALPRGRAKAARNVGNRQNAYDRTGFLLEEGEDGEVSDDAAWEAGSGSSLPASDGWDSSCGRSGGGESLDAVDSRRRPSRRRGRRRSGSGGAAGSLAAAMERKNGLNAFLELPLEAARSQGRGRTAADAERQAASPPSPCPPRPAKRRKATPRRALPSAADAELTEMPGASAPHSGRSKAAVPVKLRLGAAAAQPAPSGTTLKLRLPGAGKRAAGPGEDADVGPGSGSAGPSTAATRTGGGMRVVVRMPVRPSAAATADAHTRLHEACATIPQTDGAADEPPAHTASTLLELLRRRSRLAAARAQHGCSSFRAPDHCQDAQRIPQVDGSCEDAGVATCDVTAMPSHRPGPLDAAPATAAPGRHAGVGAEAGADAAPAPAAEADGRGGEGAAAMPPPSAEEGGAAGAELGWSCKEADTAATGWPAAAGQDSASSQGLDQVVDSAAQPPRPQLPAAAGKPPADAGQDGGELEVSAVELESLGMLVEVLQGWLRMPGGPGAVPAQAGDPHYLLSTMCLAAKALGVDLEGGKHLLDLSTLQPNRFVPHDKQPLAQLVPQQEDDANKEVVDEAEDSVPEASVGSPEARRSPAAGRRFGLQSLQGRAASGVKAQGSPGSLLCNVAPASAPAAAACGGEEDAVTPAAAAAGGMTRLLSRHRSETGSTSLIMQAGQGSAGADAGGEGTGVTPPACAAARRGSAGPGASGAAKKPLGKPGSVRDRLKRKLGLKR